MGIEWINVILLLVLCVACVYTDYSKGLIFNRLLLIIGIPAIAIHLVSGIFSDRPDVRYGLLISVVGVVLSLLMFWMKIWAGGDSKLYTVIILATPWSIISRTIWGISYVLVIPIFAFGFGFIYLFIESVGRSFREHVDMGDILKTTAKGFLQYAKYLVAIVFFDHFLSLLFVDILSLLLSTWLLILINLLFVTGLNKLKILDHTIVAVAFLVADVFLGVFRWDSFLDLRSIITWFLVCFMYFSRALTMKYNYEEISPGDLKKGMILSMACSVKLANEKGCPYRKLSDESLNARLSNDDVATIKQYCENSKAISNLVIVRKVPFALYLSIAALLIILGGSYFEFADIPI